MHKTKSHGLKYGDYACHIQNVQEIYQTELSHEYVPCTDTYILEQ